MKTILARLLNILLFLAAWVAAFMALHWLMLTQVLETPHIAPGKVPPTFSVVVETNANGAPPTYAAKRFGSLATSGLEPGESLHLSTAAYDQTEHEVTGSCCIAFKVLEDGQDGQLIELNDDDLTYVTSRYRVKDGRVLPLSHREHFVLFYFAYFFFGGIIAWLATRPIRRRMLAWARKIASGSTSEA